MYQYPLQTVIIIVVGYMYSGTHTIGCNARFHLGSKLVPLGQPNIDSRDGTKPGVLSYRQYALRRRIKLRYFAGAVRDRGPGLSCTSRLLLVGFSYSK